MNLKKQSFLTPEELKQLTLLHKKAKDKSKADRIRAIVGYNAGLSYKQMATVLILDEETLRRYVKQYLSNKKLDNDYKGSCSALNAEQTQQLSNHLQQAEPYLYVKDIVGYVKQTFGIQYSVSGIRQWLYQNGFRYKKPHGVPAKANKELQKIFLAYYQKLKNQAEKKDQSIYYIDSVHPHHQTRLVYGWIKKGDRKLLPTTAKQYYLSIVGGLCLSKKTFIFHETKKVNYESLVEFFKLLREKHPDRKLIHVILDNAGYHRNKELKKWAKSKRIRLHYLPAYSPNLNVIERLWKKLHEAVTYNRYYKDFKEFKGKILTYLKEFSLGVYSKDFESYLTDNFLIMHSPLIA